MKLVESPEGTEYLRSRLKEADALAAEGKTAEATAIWDFIYKAFGKVEHFAELAEYARQRFGGIDVPMPGAADVPPDAAPAGDGT